MKIFYIAPHNIDPEFVTKFQLITSIATKHNVEILKGIKTGKQQFDLDKTIELYNEVDYFIADLSFVRPSCYYEIGYAQAMNKKTKLIAFRNTEIHQVQGDITFYSDLDDYQKIIEKIIIEIKNEHATKYKRH